MKATRTVMLLPLALAMAWAFPAFGSQKQREQDERRDIMRRLADVVF
jgi:hypothetical protein